MAHHNLHLPIKSESTFSFSAQQNSIPPKNESSITFLIIIKPEVNFTFSRLLLVLFELQEL